MAVISALPAVMRNVLKEEGLELSDKIMSLPFAAVKRKVARGDVGLGKWNSTLTQAVITVLLQSGREQNRSARFTVRPLSRALPFWLPDNTLSISL